MSKPNFVHREVDLAWAAGLFVGEGHARAVSRGPWWYPNIQIKMLDQNAVQQFSAIVDVPWYAVRYHVDPSREAFQCASAGSRAGAALNALLPYLRDNDKREQVICAFIDSDWIKDKQSGIYVAPADRRSIGMQGNHNRWGNDQRAKRVMPV